jgi:hypothetical protein
MADGVAAMVHPFAFPKLLATLPLDPLHLNPLRLWSKAIHGDK